jgi:hypothetical protein
MKYCSGKGFINCKVLSNARDCYKDD